MRGRKLKGIKGLKKNNHMRARLDRV